MDLIKESSLSVFERNKFKYGLSETDENWLSNLTKSPKTFVRNSQVALQGEAVSNIHFLKSGWAYTAADHDDGSRTVFDVHLPGDFVISPGILSSPRRATLFTLSDCEIATLNVDNMLNYIQHSPSAARFCLNLLSDQHQAMADRVIQTTRMTAISRISMFYLELLRRVREISPETENQFLSPVTQGLMGELLGMTEVHVSRVTKRLRSLGVVSVKHRIVDFLDVDRLAELSKLSDEIAVAA